MEGQKKPMESDPFRAFDCIGLFTDAGGHLVLGNVISANAGFAIYAEGVTGFADNTITGNGTFDGSSIIGNVNKVHPNFCQPACP